MATTLKLTTDEAPWIFESLGVENSETMEFGESELFTKGPAPLALTSGKFPLNDYMNLYHKSKMTHTIGGKKVRIIGFTNSCEEGELNKYGSCTIKVVADSPAGGRRKSRRNRRGGRRYTRRR
jgi:hypothetical protein